MMSTNPAMSEGPSKSLTLSLTARRLFIDLVEAAGLGKRVVGAYSPSYRSPTHMCGRTQPPAVHFGALFDQVDVKSSMLYFNVYVLN